MWKHKGRPHTPSAPQWQYGAVYPVCSISQTLYMYGIWKMSREKYQLYTIAKYYLDLANRGRNYPQIMAMTSDQISSDSDNRITMNPGMRIMAHLTSCAFRLCTLWETYNSSTNNYRHIYYEKVRGNFARRGSYSKLTIKQNIKANLADHIFYLLRDASGHVENNAQKPWEDRQFILSDITCLEVINSMEQALNKIKNDLNL